MKRYLRPLHLALLIALALPAHTLAAPDPEAGATGWRHGVIWRAAPLAGGFPLVVKTPEGLDFTLDLEAPSGEAVLRAGIEGGRFFRLLVPNGDYVLRFAYAPSSDAQAGPGENAAQLRIAPALSFEVAGLTRKEGHVVTLSEGADGLDVAVKGLALCQRVSRQFTGPLELPRPVEPLPAAQDAPGTTLVRPDVAEIDPMIDDEDLELKLRVVICD